MSDFIHKEFPKTCDPSDYWGQVKRTVNGKPIGQDQIDMIINSVKAGLQLGKDDFLLDIGCGNGALSSLLLQHVEGLVGVDFSEYLISVAKKDFEKAPRYTFHLGDAHQFVTDYPSKSQVTKALCYGVFTYFEKEKAADILMRLNRDYTALNRVYIGNLPDRDKARDFYYANIDFSKLIDDPKSSIGIWRTKSDTEKLALECGWRIEFIQMPPNFYAAHYRYDVVLSRL